MRVGLDVTATEHGFKRHSTRGIGRYAAELGSRLCVASEHGDVVVDSFRQTSLPLPGWLASAVELLGEHRHVARQHLLFSRPCLGTELDRFDILHFLSQLDAPAWCALPYCVTVHDMIPFVLADHERTGMPVAARWRRRASLGLEHRAITRAAHVITDSQCSARDITRLTSVPAERISVVHPGVGRAFFAMPQKPPAQIRFELGLPATGAIILYVGGIDPRKNVAGLIAIYERTCLHDIAGHGGQMAASVPARLVIAGDAKGDPGYASLRQRIAASPLRSAIHEVGYVSDEDLRSLLGATAVFAFPSLYEGFGLPPLEACAAGVPVVSSDRACMPEVLGDGALLRDPEDHEAFAAAIRSLIAHPEHAAAVAHRGLERARSFTWDRTAADTMAVYERLGRELATSGRIHPPRNVPASSPR